VNRSATQQGNMHEMLLSVVIPSYNRAALLTHAVDSVLAQADAFADRIEVIVVDDGSTDASAHVLREHLRQHYPATIIAPRKGYELGTEHEPRPALGQEPKSTPGLLARIIEQPNAGAGAARNTGTRAAAGTYVLFLDGDDTLLPGALASVSAALHLAPTSPPTTVVARPLMVNHDPEDPAMRRAAQQTKPAANTPELRTWPTWLEAYAHAGAFLGAGGLCVRRDALLTAGGFPEHRLNSEDIHLQLRLGRLGPCVTIDQPSLFAYRQLPGSASRANQRTLDGWRYIVRQHAMSAYGPHNDALDRIVIRLMAQQMRAHARRFLREGDHALAWAMYRLGAGCSWRAGRKGWVLRYPASWLMRRITNRGS